MIVFDDSFLHSAGNEYSLNDNSDNGDGNLLVLIADFWHPNLHPSEIKVLRYLMKQQILAAKRINKELQQQQQEENNCSSNSSSNFLTVIESGQRNGISAEDWRFIWNSSALQQQLLLER